MTVQSKENICAFLTVVSKNWRGVYVTLLLCVGCREGKYREKAVYRKLLRQTAFVFLGIGYAQINIHRKAIIGGRKPDLTVISFHNTMKRV